MSLTSGRLKSGPNPALVDGLYRPILERDLRNFDAFVTVDLAHVVMLAEQRIIPSETAKPLLAALLDLRRAGAAALEVDPAGGGMLPQVERHLAGVAGPEVAGMLQVARSRVDQNAAVLRLNMRNRLLDVLAGIASLREVLLARAEEYKSTLMPGYTHLQHSQPWVLGHYLLAQVDAFGRDGERLLGCFQRINKSSLGGGAMAGTSWPIDRRRTAELLGHDDIVRNSKDTASASMECVAELAGALSILMVQLGRFASELYVWASAEFALVELDDGLSGTSSIMPQKKNPYALERIRALSGEAIGWMPAQLAISRTPTTTDTDRTYSSGTDVFFDQALQALALMRESVALFQAREDRMHALLADSWTCASNLADTLVSRMGVSFRTAHHIVARTIKLAVDQHLKPSQMTLETVDAISQDVAGRPTGLNRAEFLQALDAANFVQTRISEGSVGPEAVDALMAAARVSVTELRTTVDDRHVAADEAGARLQRAVQALLNA